MIESNFCDKGDRELKATYMVDGAHDKSLTVTEWHLSSEKRHSLVEKLIDCIGEKC